MDGIRGRRWLESSDSLIEYEKDSEEKGGEKKKRKEKKHKTTWKSKKLTSPRGSDIIGAHLFDRSRYIRRVEYKNILDGVGKWNRVRKRRMKK